MTQELGGLPGGGKPLTHRERVRLALVTAGAELWDREALQHYQEEVEERHFNWIQELKRRRPALYSILMSAAAYGMFPGMLALRIFSGEWLALLWLLFPIAGMWILLARLGKHWGAITQEQYEKRYGNFAATLHASHLWQKITALLPHASFRLSTLGGDAILRIRSEEVVQPYMREPYLEPVEEVMLVWDEYGNILSPR